MRILFMGTPDFAVPSLRALVDAGHTVCGAFTQPDKPKNRGMKLMPTPVKEFCLAHDIPVFQPTRLRDGTALAQIRELAPELIVVAAYGRILPGDILNYPAKGCINVHSSMLPKYRGAAAAHERPLRPMLQHDPLNGADLRMIRDRDRFQHSPQTGCNAVQAACPDGRRHAVDIRVGLRSQGIHPQLFIYRLCGH